MKRDFVQREGEEDELQMKRDDPALFEQVEVAGRVGCDYCMGWRNGREIYVARRPRRAFAPEWETRRHFS